MSSSTGAVTLNGGNIGGAATITATAYLVVGQDNDTGGIQITKPTTTTTILPGAGHRLAAQWGSQASTTVGGVYAWQGNWNTAAQANNGTTTADKLLGICLDGASGKGMLLEGTIRLGYTVGGSPGPGDILYLSDVTAGRITATKPTGAGEIIRIVGYMIDPSNNYIFFNPDATYIKL